jgi:hypothetical protein
MRNRARVLAALLGLASGLAHSDGSRAMDTSTRDRIVAAAARDHRWNAADVDVRDNAELDRGACRFFLAVNAKVPSHDVGNYAQLGDGRVAGVDVSGNDAAAAILKACGADAPADWWASVVARFSGDVGGLVLTADGNPFAIKKIRDAGVDFKPPALTRSGDAATLTFFTMDIGANRAFLATATLSASGVLTVQTKPVKR